MAEQIIKPRIRGFIAVNAHPDGCAANVREQVAIAQTALPGNGLSNAFVVGSSTGYGLASALCACFGYGAKTLGVCFERPSTEEKTGTGGWYNVAAAHRLAREQGHTLETINGDAFSHEVKREALETLRARFGKLDMLVYSLAAPRREDADSDAVWNSVLKPIGTSQPIKTVDLRSEEITERVLDAASDEEIESTIRVMGGEDWTAWVDALREADLLAEGFRTVAFSYIGPEVTHAIYRSGTIGMAKEDLEATAHRLDAALAEHCGGGALVSVNKGVVTQASAAIPAVPLYMSLLLKVMKEQGQDEGPIEQIVRLFRDHIGPGATPHVDERGLIRLDDLEMQPHVQEEVAETWKRVTTETLYELSDYAGYKRNFERLFGFSVNGVDYDAPTEVHRLLD